MSDILTDAEIREIDIRSDDDDMHRLADHGFAANAEIAELNRKIVTMREELLNDEAEIARLTSRLEEARAQVRVWQTILGKRASVVRGEDGKPRYWKVPCAVIGHAFTLATDTEQSKGEEQMEAKGGGVNSGEQDAATASLDLLVCKWTQDDGGCWHSCEGTIFGVTNPHAIFRKCPDCARPISITTDREEG